MKDYKFEVNTDGTVTIEILCPFCKKTNKLTVDKNHFDKWKSGILVQYVFPNLSVDEKEMLISGVCPKCWDEIFGKNE